MDIMGATLGGVTSNNSVVLFPRALPAITEASLRTALADLPDVPLVGSFAALDEWLGDLPGMNYFDDGRLWPVSDLCETILDLRLYSERPELWAQLPKTGGLRAAVRSLLEDRVERTVVLAPGHPLRWLRIDDGLVMRLGNDKAMLHREAGDVVLRFQGGERFTLRPGVNPVGRLPNCVVKPLARTSISRDHALIELFDDGTVAVTDQGSRNGTALEINVARLIATLTEDLRRRNGGDVNESGLIPMVADLISRVEEAMAVRVPLAFEDESALRPTAETCEAIGHAVQSVTRTDGLRVTLVTLLLATSIHRPVDTLIARLWPEGLGGVRWSDGLFFDVFGALCRSPVARSALLTQITPRGRGWEVRFPGGFSPDTIMITPSEVTTWREARTGEAAALGDGDIVMQLAYNKLVQQQLEEDPARAPTTLGGQARQMIQTLLGPAVTVSVMQVGDATCPATLAIEGPGRLVFAVRGGSVQALGRVGQGAAWVEVITPRGEPRRQRMALHEFRDQFQALLVVDVFTADETRRPPATNTVHWGAYNQ